MASLGSGSVVVVGSTSGQIGTDPAAGGQDGFVARLDPVGNVLWSHQLGSSNAEDVTSVATTPSGDIYVVGTTGGTLPGQTPAGDQDAFVAKYDKAGHRKWLHQFGTGAADAANGVAVTSAGNVYVAGTTDGAVANSGPDVGTNSDAFVAKFDRSGNQKWVRQIGSSHNDLAVAVAVSRAERVVVAGTSLGDLPHPTSSGNNQGAPFALEYDKNGALTWVTEFPGASGFNSRLDNNGVVRWTQEFGTDQNDFAMGVAVTSAWLVPPRAPCSARATPVASTRS